MNKRQKVYRYSFDSSGHFLGAKEVDYEKLRYHRRLRLAALVCLVVAIVGGVVSSKLSETASHKTSTPEINLTVP